MTRDEALTALDAAVLERRRADTALRSVEATQDRIRIEMEEAFRAAAVARGAERSAYQRHVEIVSGPSTLAGSSANNETAHG